MLILLKHITEEGADLDRVRQLFREYEKELGEDICFQRFEAELQDPLKKYGPPSGDLILAICDKEPAGCIALTALGDSKSCEMKRLYVRPAFRKLEIGKTLVESLLLSAQHKNYQAMRLDTFTKLQPAIHLYEHFGFNDISAYYDNPLPGVVYMEKTL